MSVLRAQLGALRSSLLQRPLEWTIQVVTQRGVALRSSSSLPSVRAASAIPQRPLQWIIRGVTQRGLALRKSRSLNPIQVVSAVILLGLGLLTHPAYAAERYALVVGNNIGMPSERPLRFAERDADVFADTMRQLGSVRAEDVVKVLGGTSGDVRRALLTLNARIRSRSSLGAVRSTLVIYYSGHADSRSLHLSGTKLSYEELRMTLRGSPATVRVLILDGCRSGGLTNVKGGQQGDAFSLDVESGDSIEGVVMISSSTAGEDSHESERLRASFFSHHLNNALIGAGDQNGDGLITLNEAYRYAYQHTLEWSGRTRSLQHPTYAYDLKGRGELIMTDLRYQQDRYAYLELAKPGLYLVFQQTAGNQVVAEVQAKKAGVQILLKPDRYLIQRRDTDHYLEYAVSLKPGTRMRLREHKRRRVAYAELVRKGSSTRAVNHGIYGLGFARGPIIEDQGLGVGASIQYGLDLQHMSIAFRFRAAMAQTARSTSPDGDIAHRELAVGLSAQKFFDVGQLSLGAGVNAEILEHKQSFSNPGSRARSTLGATLGIVLTLQYSLFGPLLLRAEGGPMTYVFRLIQTRTGEAVDERVSTPLTGWAAIGVGWMF